MFNSNRLISFLYFFRREIEAELKFLFPCYEMCEKFHDSFFVRKPKEGKECKKIPSALDCMTDFISKLEEVSATIDRYAQFHFSF